ncbi:MAG: hypothetical protein R3336_09275, partial [Phycisphaeraceae bacterium]|nr:hypothetical protein [Phycisphaeraceae bacterium]
GESVEGEEDPSLAATRGQVEAFAEKELTSRVSRWRTALVLSNAERDELAAVLAALPVTLRWRELDVVARKRLLGGPYWDQVRRLASALADRPGVEALLEKLEPEADALLAEGVSPDPLLDGSDLIDLGVEPGPKLGEALEALYDAQLAGEISDRPAAEAWMRDYLEAE